jgi:hypothetical protein
MRGSVHQNSGFGLLASGRPLGQQGGEDFLALGECAVHLGSDQESVRDATGETEAYFVVDYVAESRAFDPGACFCFEFVAVMPGFERAFVLYVGEMVVPFEFGDAGDPMGAQREEREDAERGDDDRADSGRALGRRVGGRRWRRHPVELEDSCSARCGHNPGEVLGIREEREDAGEREGSPVLEFEVMRHESRIRSEPIRTSLGGPLQY